MDFLSLFMFHVCLYYSVVTYWERTDLLALLCVMFICVFVAFQYGVPDPVRYLIVLIPELCILLYLSK